ncbi:MAG: hypothetical protein ABR926_20060 [Streptosporangiaceae bacterium]
MTERGGVQPQRPFQRDLRGGLADGQPGRLAEGRQRSRMVVQPLQFQGDGPGELRGRWRLGAQGRLGRRGERPAHPDRTQPFGPFREGHGLGRPAALQPPLDTAMLVPGEQVEVHDFLTAGHQAVVQRFHASLADRAERELERLTADRVRGVRVFRRGRRPVPQPGQRGLRGLPAQATPRIRSARRRQGHPVERLPAAGPHTELLLDLAFLDKRGWRHHRFGPGDRAPRKAALAQGLPGSAAPG